MIDQQKKIEFAKFQKEYTAETASDTDGTVALTAQTPPCRHSVPENVVRYGKWNRATQVLVNGQEGSSTESEKLLKKIRICPTNEVSD